jgi:hypothetical protein
MSSEWLGNISFERGIVDRREVVGNISFDRAFEITDRELRLKIAEAVLLRGALERLAASAHALLSAGGKSAKLDLRLAIDDASEVLRGVKP